MTISAIRYSKEEDTSVAQQLIYDRLLQDVRSESAEVLIENFYDLFIEGTGYKDLKVRQALEKIVKVKGNEEQFYLFLNRCCHIFINHWQMQSNLQPAIRELIDLFQNLRSPDSVYSRVSKRLRVLVKNFTQTQYYIKLQRLARVIDKKETTSNYVGNLITRYPYLYEHCLLSEDSSYEAKRVIQKIQFQNQHNFELDLSRYVTYQVRLGQMLKSGELSQAKLQNMKPAFNPTLLSDGELGSALKHFVGKAEEGRTYRDLSQSFLAYSNRAPNYKSFKNNLYEYLLPSIDSRYGGHQFNNKLHKKIQNILPNSDNQKPSDFLILRTGCQLIDFLVVASSRNPQHYVFVDLITNIGPTNTVGLLLKLVLLCNKLKPYLEKRFSILFGHYESFTREGVPWLIKSLENTHVAFSIYFGKVDLSCLNHIIRVT
ncbi:MAG: hypothetical protein ACFBSE_21830, partial [Prochloraceae cyanobacterium]